MNNALIYHNKTNRVIINLFIFILSIYFLTASLYNCYFTDVSQLRLQILKSLLENQELTVPEGFGLKGISGKDYSWFSIGSPLLALPLYTIGILIGTSPEELVSTINQFFGAATVVLIYLFIKLIGYSQRTCLLVSIVYGLGTFAWPHAKHPFDHVIETFFILLSVYSIYLYSHQKQLKTLLLSGISIGFAFITRTTSIIAILPILSLIFVSHLSKSVNSQPNIKLLLRDIMLFSIGFLPFLFLFFWYNYYRFGSIFETGYQLIANRAGINFFTGTALWDGLRGLLISPGKGYFYYSPTAVLFFFALRSFLKKHARLGFCFIFLIISFLLLFSQNICWHGDWAWGPRYLLVITPFFIIPIADLFEKKVTDKISFMKFIVVAIFLLSVAIQLLGISVDFQSYFIYMILVEKIPFTSVHAEGMRVVLVPPPETYFDWTKSHILMQLQFVTNICRDIGAFKYSTIASNARLSEIVVSHPLLDGFDFWWLNKYLIEGIYSGFGIAALLLLMIIYNAIRLYQYIIKCDKENIP